MATTIRVEIVSAEAGIFSGEARLVVAPAVIGDIGIMPKHSPLITRLRPGELRVVDPSEEERIFYVSGGILEIQPSVVTVLSDVALRAEDIDEQASLRARDRAEKEKRRAEKAIAEGVPVFDYAKAKAELAEAAAQLRTLEDLRKRAGTRRRSR